MQEENASASRGETLVVGYSVAILIGGVVIQWVLQFMRG